MKRMDDSISSVHYANCEIEEDAPERIMQDALNWKSLAGAMMSVKNGAMLFPITILARAALLWTAHDLLATWMH